MSVAQQMPGNTARVDGREESEENEGFRVAWAHLCQAWHALARPAARHLARLPRLSTGMRIYLLANITLYGIAAAQFLVAITRLSTPGVDPLTGAPAARVLWGVTAAAVTLAQVVTLVVRDRRAWQVCAVVTAMWASAYGMAILVQTVRHGLNYGGVVLWAWVLVLHFLMIRNQIMPASDDAAARHDDDAEESELVTRLHAMLAPSGTGKKE